MDQVHLTKPIKEERYVFETQWYDQQADVIRRYRLFFFPETNSIEMWDKKTHQVFLKRIQAPQLTLGQLYVGGKVTIYGRLLEIMEYGDVATAAKQTGQRESTFAMIKPCSYQNFGKIIDAVCQ